MIGLLRVKDEARWIERVLKSIKPVCETILVMDDHSTDDTPVIAERCGAIVIPSPFEGLLEARDKDYLLEQAWNYANVGDWALAIDGDEELNAADIDELKLWMERGLDAALSFRVLYLWNDPNTVRVDGVYRSFRRASAFKLIDKGLRFAPTSYGGQFHCGNVPWQLQHNCACTGVRLLHYGYMHPEDRIRKYEWYNAKDPNNSFEDGYRHMVVGDLFPETAKFTWGGPLQTVPIAEA